MKTIKFFMVFAIFFMLSGLAMAEHLEWDASTGATGYIVYYNDGADMFNYNIGNQTVCALTDPAGPLNMIPGKTYDIHIKAYNGVNLSGESNHVPWTEPSVFTPPENYVPTFGTAPEDVAGLQNL